MRVDDVMHTGEGIPTRGPDDAASEGLVEMTGKGLGMRRHRRRGRLVGIFTDGDLRRCWTGASTCTGRR